MEGKEVFLCGIDWQHEIDAVDTLVHPSLECAKRGHPPWDSCGIVKARMVLVEWVVPQDLEKGAKRWGSLNAAYEDEANRYQEAIDEIMAVQKQQPLGPHLTRQLEILEMQLARVKRAWHQK